MKFVLQKIIYPACLIFTVLIVLFSALLSWSGASLEIPYMDISSVLELLGYSLLLTSVGALFSKLDYFLALAIHFAATVGGSLLIFYVIGKKENMLAVSGIIAVVYIVLAVIQIIVRAVKNKGGEEKNYTRQFR